MRLFASILSARFIPTVTMAGLGCQLFESLDKADEVQLRSQWGMRRILALLDAQMNAVHESCKLCRSGLENFIMLYVGGTILDDGCAWRIRLDDTINNELCIKFKTPPTNDCAVSVEQLELRPLELLAAS